MMLTGGLILVAVQEVAEPAHMHNAATAVTTELEPEINYVKKVCVLRES